jgi:hypothetical protein
VTSHERDERPEEALPWEVTDDLPRGTGLERAPDGCGLLLSQAGGKFGVVLGEVGPGSRGGGQRIGGGGVAA